MKSTCLVLLALLIANCLATVQAQEPEPWSDHRVTLYGWGSGFDGKVRIAPLPSVEINRSFSETLSSLDFAAMAAYETRGERWGLFLDLQTVDLSDRGRVPLLGVRGRIETDLEGALLAGNYRFLKTQRAYLDLIGGLRYWEIDTEASIQVPPSAIAPIPTIARNSRSLTLPQLGLKGTWLFGRGWFMTGWAMAVAKDSNDLNSDIMLAAGYAFSSHWSLLLGYRRIGFEFENNRIDLDFRFSGPGLALDYRF